MVDKLTWEEMGPRERDALVGSNVMHLNIVATDWPCGYSPDGSDYEADQFPDDGPASWYSDRGPVYLPDGKTWPPKVDVHGKRVAWVEPIPFYTTSISAAWEVLMKFGDFTVSHGKFAHQKWLISIDAEDCEADEFADEFCNGVCLTALRAVGIDI